MNVRERQARAVAWLTDVNPFPENPHHHEEESVMSELRRVIKRVSKAIGGLLGGATGGAVIATADAFGVEVSTPVAAAIAVLLATFGTWLAPPNAPRRGDEA